MRRVDWFLLFVMSEWLWNLLAVFAKNKRALVFLIGAQLQIEDQFLSRPISVRIQIECIQ